MKANYVINIGRQLGSGGREIGFKLASRLGIDFYDKELIDLASEESGLCKDFFEDADEKTSKRVISRVFDLRFSFVNDGILPIDNCLSYDALFKIQSDIIRRLASEKSCLFVGRCADYILREHHRCINIFISSIPEDRITRLSKRHQINAEEAEKMMDKVDKQRAEYYNYYSCNSWGTASTYHLRINSSVLGIDSTVEFLAAFVTQKLEL